MNQILKKKKQHDTLHKEKVQKNGGGGCSYVCSIGETHTKTMKHVRRGIETNWRYGNEKDGAGAIRRGSSSILCCL